MVEAVAIDTNILVRFISADHAEQFERTLRIFAKHHIWISQTVLLETEWILRNGLEYDKSEIISAFRSLLQLNEVMLEDEKTLELVLDATETGMDFADALHLYNAHRNELPLLTFDKSLVKRSQSITPESRLA